MERKDGKMLKVVCHGFPVFDPKVNQFTRGLMIATQFLPFEPIAIESY
jgi:hypothetical protein